MNEEKPIIGITMGDPAGIGPEVIVKALQHAEIYQICRPCVIGDASVFQTAAALLGGDAKIRAVCDISSAQFQQGIIDVLDQKSVPPGSLEYGKVSANAGKAAFQAVEEAIRLAIKGEVDGTVTAPINKEAINLAGFHFSGHTEIYAHKTGSRDYAMLLIHENLRIAHVSTHVSLREACDLVKKDRVLRVIQLSGDACKKFGVGKPRIGVAGLNPHAGENGMFGNEEILEIAPAVERARREGYCVDGPLPPDSIFSKARGGNYDIVVAMYHDQGHIPLKTAGFLWDEAKQQWKHINGVNITLGLPIVRTSVDHGTAFEIAWKGIASENSMVNAIEYAVKLTKK